VKKAWTTVAHHGFGEEQMRAFFEDAGLVDFGVEVVARNTVFRFRGREMRRDVFIAKGRKA
jgi:hypothetical protein